MKTVKLMGDTAHRANVPDGTIVQVEMYSEEELKKRPNRKNFAKHIYVDGKRIGGFLDLDNVKWLD